VERVRAAAQARVLRALESIMTDAERDLVRRARNVKGAIPRSADQDTYRQATAFEALIGYRYLAGPPERLEALLALADRTLEEGMQDAK
jgi:ribonuclease-3 family protein